MDRVQERMDRMRPLVNKGMGPTGIMRELGLTRREVTYALSLMGVRFNKVRISREEYERVGPLIADELRAEPRPSYSEIGRRYGVHYTVVRNIHIRLRERGTWEPLNWTLPG